MPRYFSHRSYSRWTPRRYMRPARSGYQTKKIAAQVNKAIVSKAEHKYNLFAMATFLSSSGIGTSWTENTYVPAQGAGLSDRIGNKISITELSFSAVLVGGQSNLATDDNRNWFRLVMGIWKNSASGAASSHTPLYSNSYPAHLPIDKQTQPTLLIKCYDKTIVLNSPGRDSTGYMPAQKSISCTYKFSKPVVVTWDALGVPDKQFFMSAPDSSLLQVQASSPET